MTRSINLNVVVALAISLGACAQTSSTVARPAYTPAGQAAQPGWLTSSLQREVRSDGTPAGQAAQPGFRVETEAAPRERIYATGIPAGRAGQPNSWITRAQ